MQDDNSGRGWMKDLPIHFLATSCDYNYFKIKSFKIRFLLVDEIEYPHGPKVVKFFFFFLNKIQKVLGIKDISSVFNLTQIPCGT